MSDQTQPPAVTEQKDPALDRLRERARELEADAVRIRAQFDMAMARNEAALSEVRDHIGWHDSKKRTRKPRVVADQPAPDVVAGEAA